MTDPNSHRTGQPEADALLDRADTERRAVAELVTINHAEDLVTHVRQADLAAEHQALHERYEQAEAELAAATASGDPARIAGARRVRDEASATCDRAGRTLREELAGLAEAGLRAHRRVAGEDAHRLADRGHRTQGAPAQHPGCRPARRRR
ncbi:hypothetical protein E1292_43240 [Nonomuraea deserti]|uniref:Uncharacterized protein n=1 Tax=Nonomuraea deserti TaxID=1848322 RepID=A0A4V6PC88_9ACTN|nr:hypothetical protein [Nonomuraea deserti]TDC90805.1 hypothetical protein E1292_43240 [Nonomuraea deserti]